MEKIQISESQLRQMIREEGEKIKKEIILRATLQKIDQELSGLKEVHAGGNMAPGKEGVHAGQKKAVFTKKGTHLVEDETEEMGSEEVPTEVPVEDVSMETPSEEQAETISKDAIMAALQDLGNKLDLTGTVEFTGDGDEMGGEDNIDLDVDVENGAEDAIGSEEGGEEMGSEEMGSEEIGSEEGGEEEPVDECGTKPMEENKPEMVAENTDPKKQKLMEERERMRKLAGLIKEGK